MNRTQYADLVDEITTTDIEVTRAASLPALEPSASRWLARCLTASRRARTPCGGLAAAAALRPPRAGSWRT